MSGWDLRSALRYGSKHERFVESEAQATAIAKAEIEKYGDKGQITYIDQEHRVLIYDVHAPDE